MKNLCRRSNSGKEDRYSDRRNSDKFEENSEPPRREYDYGRRSSTESFQTVKIRKSDLDEIRRRYDLKYKNRESAKLAADSDERSNIYKYSSNMRNMTGGGSRNSSEPNSGGADRSQSDHRRSNSADSVRDSYGRQSKTQSSDSNKTVKRKKREWRVGNNLWTIP